MSPTPSCAGSPAVARSPGGALRYEELRSAPTLVLRATPAAVYMVGGMATPLGGDEAGLRLTVGDGAAVTVRSAGSALARRGPGGGSSVTRVRVGVGAGASLHWAPAPVVAAAGCHHEASSRLCLDPEAAVVWRETVVLGREGEPPGSCSSALSVDVAGRPLLRSELAIGPGVPGWDSPAVGGGARVLGSVLLVDRQLPALPEGGAHLVDERGRGVVTELAGGGVLVAAMAARHVDLSGLLCDLVNELPECLAQLLDPPPP